MANVARSWKSVFRASHPGLQLTVSVIFTHQSPYVVWTGGNRCELADLMIAFLDRTAAQPRGVATLIQAKQSDTNFVTLTTVSERKQFELLSCRPVFDVEPATAPNGINLRLNGPDVAFLYGLTPPDTPPVLACHWPRDRWGTAEGLAAARRRYTVTAHRGLAQTLVELVQGNSGWYFDLSPAGHTWRHFSAGPTRDDWAMLINYLLERSFTRPAVIAAAGGAGARREEHLLYLQARSHSGNPMFFMQYLPENVSPPLPLTCLPQHSDATEGDILSLDWVNADTEEIWPQNGGDGEARDRLEQGPEDGPISAIVFEFNRGSRAG